jgi:hypothetical protein
LYLLFILAYFYYSFGGVRGGFPSSWEGLGVGFPLANTAGDTQAGGDGGQDGCYCLNDEFPSFFLHVVH